MLWLTGGTVSVASGGTAVTGVGTSFTQARVGSEICFGGPDKPWYLVTAIADDTHLTISEAALAAWTGSAYALRPVTFSMEKDFVDRIDSIFSRYDAAFALATNDRVLTLDKVGASDYAEVLFRQGGADKARIGLFANNALAAQSWNGSAWSPALGEDGPESTVASAATTDIGSANTERVAISGTTTITSFGAQINKRRFVRFTGSPLITASGSLLLPGGANIQAAAGDKAIFISDASGNWICYAYTRATGRPVAASREVLTAGRNYYVRSDGSDSNDGLSNTSGGAFATIQKAIDTAAGVDSSIYDVTINVGSGITTSGGIVLKRLLGSGTLNIVGDETTQSNCTITNSNQAAILQGSGTFLLAGFKLASSASQDFYVEGAAKVTLRNIEYAGTANYRIYATQGGVIYTAGANNKISGGGIGMLYADAHGKIYWSSSTFTLTANVTYSSAFASCRNSGYVESVSATHTLGAFAVTGARYAVTFNGVILTGVGANNFPGNSAGSTSTGGQYA